MFGPPGFDVHFRAEGALSIVAPENIVENRSVLKTKRCSNT